MCCCGRVSIYRFGDIVVGSCVVLDSVIGIDGNLISSRYSGKS